jgi:hypothetical protein
MPKWLTRVLTNLVLKFNSDTDMKKLMKILVFLPVILGLTSCEDFFAPDTDDILPENKYVGDYTELYSGFMGLAASMQSVADQASFLEGLRNDLLEPTNNAPREFWDVYNYNNLDNNKLADPAGYYNIILNANDYIQHTLAFMDKNPNVISETEYKGLIGGAIRFKVWAYLMLAKIYGEAIYFDETITEYKDLSQYTVLNYDQLIQKCRELMENGTAGIDGLSEIRWSTVLFPGQADSPTNLMWNRICPPAEVLLAEIYLNQNEYQKAWEKCVAIIKRGGENEASYQLNLSEYNGEWKQFGYTFVRKEQISVAFFDFSLKQTNRYIEYYSNNYPNKYYLRPTEVNRKRFENQYNASGVLNDQYRGSGVTYKLVNNDYVLQKFLAGHETSDKIYMNDVQISFYRAAEVHLMLIEALVGMGRFEEALGFLNNGIGSYYNATVGKFNAPFTPYPSCLYRTSSTSEMANRGVRGRVNLSELGGFSLSKVKLNGDSVNALDTLIFMQRLDSIIVEETALELAGEGKAHYAMNRMVRRWSAQADKSWANQWIDRAGGGNPGNLWGDKVKDYAADKIAAKYQNGNGPAISSALKADLKNWFISFDLKNQ